MTQPTVAELATIDLFDDVDPAALEQFAAIGEIQHVEAGVVIAEPGAEAGLTLLLEGRAEASVASGAHFEPVGEHVAPTWIGAINALTGAPFGVRMESLTPIRLAHFPKDEFVEFALANRVVFHRVMARVRPVTARINAREQNRERLASLGTMAAGLAHELNNPASAAQRAAADLAEALEVLGSTVGAFVDADVGRIGAGQLVAMQRQVLTEAANRPALATLDASDAEDALGDALEAIGVEDGWRIAEPLARAGVNQAFLEAIREIAGAATAAALRWIAASLTARELVAELTESTERMKNLVTAVKRYAYMDRGGLVEVDLHEGLETTLTILGHKLKHTEIKVVRDYDRSLPHFLALGAELNQVWTNLIHNAIDALGERGTITLTTRRDGSCIEVDIADDGPGIPDDVREHIFDPFFTTKEVGSGTGLGLDTARQIVVDRHHGSLQVQSTPGSTVFRTRLPVAAA